MNANVAERHAEAFTDTPVFEGLARAGYVARGALYALIGVLAIRLADGVGGPRPNQQGALQQIEHQPFGHALLILTAIGLGGYAFWRLAQALVGHTPEYGEHSKLDRIGAVGSAAAYAAFCALAIARAPRHRRQLLGPDAQDDGGRPPTGPPGASSWPRGPALHRHRRLPGVPRAQQEVPRRTRRPVRCPGACGRRSRRSASTGLLARAVAFGLIGIFVLKAARDYTPEDAVGLDGALARLLQHSYGTAALIVVACGLIAFGVYSLADARYRRI